MVKRIFQNKLEKEIWRRKKLSEMRLAFVILSSAIICGVMIFSKPSIALAYNETDISQCPNIGSFVPDGYKYVAWVAGSNAPAANAPVVRNQCGLVMGTPSSTSTIQTQQQTIGGNATITWGGSTPSASGFGSTSNMSCYKSGNGTGWILIKNGDCWQPTSLYNLTAAGNRQIRSNVSPSSNTLMKTNISTITANGNQTVGSWSFTNGQVIYGLKALTVLTPAPIFQNQNISYNVEWSNLGFDPLYYAYLPDLADGTGTVILNNYDAIGAYFDQTPLGNPSGTGGSFEFEATITQPNSVFYPYRPTVILTDCGIWPLQSGCNYEIITADQTIDVNAGTYSLDFAYPSDFYSGRTIIKVGESINYYWNVDSGICSPGTITGKRIFKGYNYPQIDSGSIIISNSGSISLSYPAEGFDLKPKIRVYCSSGVSHDLYLGNTWDSTRAVTVYVLDEAEYEQATNSESYTNGGTGTGGYTLFSDRSSYVLFQNAYFKWTFNNFDFGTITNVRFYKDRIELPDDYYDFNSIDDLNKSLLHRFVTTYSIPGQYQPSLVISSATNSVEIFIGGDQSPDPSYSITVFNEQRSTAGLGGLLGKFGSGGIFGIVDFRIPTAQGAPFYITTLIYLANQSIEGLVWLANYSYGLLLESNFFRWWADAIAPPESARTVPASILGITIPLTVAERDFTISYSEDANPLGKYFLLFLVISFIAYITNKLVH